MAVSVKETEGKNQGEKSSGKKAGLLHTQRLTLYTSHSPREREKKKPTSHFKRENKKKLTPCFNKKNIKSTSHFKKKAGLLHTSLFTLNTSQLTVDQRHTTH